MDFYEKAIEQRNEKLANWDEDNKDYYYELMGDLKTYDQKYDRFRTF